MAFTRQSDSASLKFRRAQYHFNCLKLAYSRLQKANLRKPPNHYQVKPGEETTLEVRVQPNARWGLMIGDCVNNLRSALDHVAFRLVPESIRLTYADKISFPINSTSGKYGVWKNRNASWFTSVNPEAVEIIDRLQPGDGGNLQPRSDPLWTLHQLSNLDKHRNIHVAFVGIRELHSPEGVVVWLEEQTRTINLTFPPGPTEMNMHLQITVEVAFKDGEDVADLPVFPTLSRIGQVVANALNRLGPYTV